LGDELISGSQRPPPSKIFVMRSLSCLFAKKDGAAEIVCNEADSLSKYGRYFSRAISNAAAGIDNAVALSEFDKLIKLPKAHRR
jgi:hypothetical protein